MFFLLCSNNLTAQQYDTIRYDTMDLADKTKDKIPVSAAAGKRTTRKKPKDKPKRPLSAYNYFFKEEREKILKILSAEDPYKVEQDPTSHDFLSAHQITSLKKEGNKVSFEQMGKIIGARWKNIDPDRLAKFSEMASEDTERYKKQMQSYNGRQEAKMRSEALKPQAYHQGPPRGGRPEAGQPPDPRQQPYPDMGSYAGYGGYGMDAYGYYGYGGYGAYSGYPAGSMGGSPEQMDQYSRQMYAAQGSMGQYYPDYGAEGYYQSDPYQGYPQGGWGGSV
ncbi:high mobility group [Seminavis robusta]|uniref:High mobility group n=1 Tax=Seminavis robusta TaxID=568900 RepID=A0A9N8EB98_9STRA|nr:high mobility group [Seminavis robusta]|eukprot:Sro834_g208630.1 high mobility group (278) ;mRNA; r:6583-7683